jgi:anti-sigma B factor antagonist
MKIKREDQGPVTVLRLEGKLMGGPDSEEVQHLLRRLVAEGRIRVLIDMAEVSWVNSTGLSVLISGYHSLRNAGGALKLVNTSPRIEQIFTVTGLDTVFESFEDESKALGSF